MIELNKIFFGNTPSEQRKFITKALQHLQKEGYEKVIIPCCGQFTLAKCAIEAGFKPSHIRTSDISLFSNLLGYCYSNKSIETLGFRVLPPYDEEYARNGSEFEKIAYLLLMIKLCQFRVHIYYEKRFFDELMVNRDAHIQSLAKKIEKFKSFYNGLHYSIEDLRNVTQCDGPGNVILINPPAFSKGYTRMFKFEDVIDYRVSVIEWEMKKEYVPLYFETKKMNCPVLWYRYQDTDGIPADDVLFAKEYTTKRFDYWLCTKPDLLKHLKKVFYTKGKKYRPYRHHRIFSDGDELRPDSKISFVKVPEENALYYREVFAHRLGDVKAELYMLVLIDGKVFSTVGFYMSRIFSMSEDYVFEVFGFSAPSRMNLNRLLMYLITCKDFEKVLRKTASSKNRFYRMRGLKTTCLSKYRKVKTNNGILQVIKKEKLKNDMYRLVYQTDWHDRTFKDCVKIFLEEEQKRKYGAS